MSEELVRFEKFENGLARVRMNTPKNSNALEVDMLRALHEVLMKVHGDDGIRAVLLTGEGKNFCGGGDVKTFYSKGKELSGYIRQATSYLMIVANAIKDLRAPVVAAVQGFAAGGGGLGLVCIVDLVVAGESTKLLAGATRVAMAPDAGLSSMLARHVGFRRAMDILLTNRVIDSKEALSMGLVNRVVPDAEIEAAALKLANELAEGAPLAQAETKRLLYRSLALGPEGNMPEESRVVANLSGTEDSMEGLLAVIERRPPQFKGR